MYTLLLVTKTFSARHTHVLIGGPADTDEADVESGQAHHRNEHKHTHYHQDHPGHS